MNTEQEVRLNFLEEAEDYLDRIESVLLNLSTNGAEPQSIDTALRAAHSIKGGAATMGFEPMSRIAHRLEDFFKILRVRPEFKTEVSSDVETLLLQGLDSMRQVRDLHRQGSPIDEDWYNSQTQPIFTALVEHLGELKPEDENALLIQEEGDESALLIFEGAVEAILEEFSSNLNTLPAASLHEELEVTAVQLAELGRMANIESFVDLATAVQQQLPTLSGGDLKSFARRAVELWERAHAMVLLGQTEKLSGLQGLVEEATEAALATPTPDFESQPAPDFDSVDFAVGDLDLSGLDLSAMELPDIPFPDAVNMDTALEQLDPSGIVLPEAVNLDEIKAVSSQLETETPAEAFEHLDLDAVASQMRQASSLDANLNIDIDAFTDITQVDLAEVEPPDLTSLLEDMPIEEEVFVSVGEAVEEQPPLTSTAPQLEKQSEIASTQAAEPLNSTVRIPVNQLRQLNNLFGKLILERNTINSQLERVLEVAALMKERLNQLEQSNGQLRKWYDRASMEGVLSGHSAAQSTVDASALVIGNGIERQSRTSGQTLFDSLEMDRYTDLHLLSQDQMETIVQLQEVAADIDLGLREMTQSSTELNQTTRSLQGNVMRMQMRPFSEVVKRFPRLIRDLSRQYGKPVNLQLDGEATLIDRSILNSLTDPLTHLIRNAFDHGIESAEARAAAGKPATGVISVHAANRGNTTAITISDDGGGINLDAIRARARKIGVPDEHLNQCSEREILDLIFESGFSTAKQVTELSGRGVGMDVVKTNITAMRGEISIDTQPGQGTTFTINVPFMMSVLRVMLLEAAGMVFAVPAESVQFVEQLEDGSIGEQDGREEISVGERTIPLIRLERKLRFPRHTKLLSMDGTPKVNRPTAVIFHQHESLGGLYIQRIWGEQEVATSTIQTPVGLPPGFGSSTILGDGRVVPLIDPIQLLQWLSEESDSAAELGEQSAQVPNPSNETTTESILIVDDSINVRRYLAMTLEKSGYQVEQAKDGQEALDMLVSGLSVSAVISDIEMPRLDGYGLLSELRSRTDFENLPISMLTSRSSEKHRKLAMKLGASAYLSKPYTEQELLSTVESLLQH